MLGLMRDVRAEVPACEVRLETRLTDDAVPCWVVLLVEFLLDEGGDVLFNVELLERLGCNIDSVLLHV